jgi:alkylhydroperoxidase family enzyme
MVNVLVIEDSAPLAKDVLCTRGAAEKASAECMAVHRAVLTARMQKVSALKERGRWM